MPLSSEWPNENTIYNHIQSSGEATFINVEICIDIKNSDILPSYITRKILKGTEKVFFKNLGEKCNAKDAKFFAYTIIDNKVDRYYYSSINIIKKGSLVWFNHDRFIVESLDGENLLCRNREKELSTISQKEVSVMRY